MDLLGSSRAVLTFQRSYPAASVGCLLVEEAGRKFINLMAGEIPLILRVQGLLEDGDLLSIQERKVLCASCKTPVALSVAPPECLANPHLPVSLEPSK